MRSSDVEYIYDTNPYQKMNLYPMDLNRNTILQFVDKMKEENFKHTVKKLKTGHYSIEMLRKDGSRVATLRNPVYPTNSKPGRQVAIDKFKTERYLKEAGLKTTNSRLYTAGELEKAKSEAYKESSKGVVIKPLDMSLGKGVFVNVVEEDFEHYWQKCVDVMSKRKIKEFYILVQDFMEGFEVRATILEGSLISVVARVPAFVKGDGQSSIEELIDAKNEDREKCGYLSKNHIKKSDAVKSFIKHAGYDFNSVPKEGEYVLLISVSNTSLGGEVIDITYIVSDEIKELALNALAALPGMYCGGIDVMVRNFKDQDPRVIEINPFPVLSLTMFPTYGEPTKPADYFLNAFYTKDQLENDVPEPYDIEEQTLYIKNYMRYHSRQQKMQLQQFQHSE